MKAVVTWAFDEDGNRCFSVAADGDLTFIGWDCPEHPGKVESAVLDLDDGDALSLRIRDDIEFMRNPHDCLPSPFCETCGRQALPEEAMRNAVMKARFGHEADPSQTDEP